MIHKNVQTDFARKVYDPVIDTSAYVHPLAAVIGNVTIGKNVMVSPFASIRGDEGQPLYVGDNANVQDGVIIHALETEHEGHQVEKNMVTVDGKGYAVYVSNNVSLAHQVQIHGPAFVGHDTFIGMQSLVFKARVGNNCVIEPGCIIMGANIPDGHYVPAGSVVNDQAKADVLAKKITDDYAFKDLNRGVIHVNTGLAAGYNKAGM
ncbi:MAG: carbonic anhydrase [Spirochaetes bacterium]|nr:carbonic anhydrase [Spirochaetota bacterium]